jgi:DnaK suppressor protein
MTAKKTAVKVSPAAKTEVKNIELPKGYKPSEKEAYMSPEQLEYFRLILLAWKAELIDESAETLTHLKEENWNEPDLNDRATVETETSLELRTRDRYRKLIYKIDAALRRIEQGEYGYCEETGDPIGIKRLEARPIATLSIAAQERHERNERQQNDE